MSLRIADGRMDSDETTHCAVRVVRDDESTWIVSWLPDRPLTRNKAVTAMTLAEAVNGDDEHAHRFAPHLADWAGELDLDDTDAARLAKDPT